MLEFSMGHKKKAIFKHYCMEQQILLPPSLDELLPENHIARVINRVVNRIDTSKLQEQYTGGGASSYHPLMMLKILILAYTQKLYSCRKIAKALRENIAFMWIAGGNKPDFRTLNRFRSGPLKETLEELFASLTEFLLEEGYVSLENYFLDGTKIEANAGKYTWVWKRATDKFKLRLSKEIRDLMDHIDEINEEEDRIYGDRDLDDPPEGSKPLPELIDEAARIINERLKKLPENKDLKKIKKKIEEDYRPRSEKYEEQGELFNGRNSYSKTDTDATFMRMKEDAMKNGQLKPGYNVQIGTENQFILAYSIHPSPNDLPTFKEHMEKVKNTLNRLPKRVIADSGYGSEENYNYCDENQVEKYIKFSMFHREQKRKYQKDPYNKDNWPYNAEEDTFLCPQGKTFVHVNNKQNRSSSGYVSTEKVYKGPGCRGCPQKADCAKGSGDRGIGIREKWEMHKTEVREVLMSEEGLKMRSLRPIEPESVFGQIKQNMEFRRFHLRGNAKVQTEWGLISMAHNIRKVARKGY